MTITGTDAGGVAAVQEHPARSGTLLTRLSRKTTGGRFIPAIDGLRFVAIAMVLLVHTSGLVFGRFERHLGIPVRGTVLGQTVHGGMFGVQLFFIISGFVLGLPFAMHALAGGQRVRLKSYYWRRITRLEPPYLVAMIVALALGVLLAGDALGTQLPHFFAGLPYLHWVFFPGHNPVNTVTWSLEVEIQFYLLVPLLTQVFRIQDRTRRRLLLLGGAAVSAVLAHLFIPVGSQASLTILAQLPYFLVGFLLVDVYLMSWRSAPVLTRAWDVVFAATVLIGWLVVRSPEVVWWAFPVVGFAFCCAAFRSPIASRFLSRPWIFTIGGMCYSIYLLHLPLIRIAWNWTGGLVPPGHFAWDIIVQAAVLIPFVLVASAIFFVLVERPCMDKTWPARAAAWLRSPTLRATTSPAPGRTAPTTGVRTETSRERSRDEATPR